MISIPKKSKDLFIRGVLLVLFSCSIQSVWATGFNFWESSALNSGLASANGAKGVDASILALAPSSMTQIEQRQVSFNLTYYAVSTEYEIFSQSASYQAADPIPAGFVVFPIHQNWHFGAGIYSRTAADISVPSIPLINPQEVQIRPILLSVAPSVAYQFGSLSIAGTLEYIYAEYLLNQTTTQIEETTSGWSGALSATWRTSDRVSMTLAHQFPSHFGDGNLQVDLPNITRFYLTIKLLNQLEWHQNYSYSQWENSGFKFSDYPDRLGLLVGAEDSHRYATSLEYQMNQFRCAAGFSVDQAIDDFGGNDTRFRLGGGYQLTPSLSLDLTYFHELYAKKEAVINGQPVVQVQNSGNALSLGVRYSF